MVLVMAGCSLKPRNDVTGPTAACSGPPSPVGFLGWTTATVPAGSVTLFWDAATGVVASHVVELGTTRGATNVGTAVVSGTASSHTFERLAAGDYFARVRARNDCGVSAPSYEANPRVR